MTGPAPRAFGTRPRRRLALWLSGTLLALVVAALLSIAVGANPLDPRLLLDTLSGGGTDESRFVVQDQRLPRTLVGLAVGVGLGGAGALIQAVTRNPLADPGILR